MWDIHISEIAFKESNALVNWDFIAPDSEPALSTSTQLGLESIKQIKSNSNYLMLFVI